MHTRRGFFATDIQMPGRSIIDRQAFDEPRPSDSQFRFARERAAFVELLHPTLITHIHRTFRVHRDRVGGQPLKATMDRAWSFDAFLAFFAGQTHVALGRFVDFLAEHQHEFPVGFELLHTMVAHILDIHVPLRGTRDAVDRDTTGFSELPGAFAFDTRLAFRVRRLRATRLQSRLAVSDTPTPRQQKHTFA